MNENNDDGKKKTHTHTHTKLKRRILHSFIVWPFVEEVDFSFYFVASMKIFVNE